MKLGRNDPCPCGSGIKYKKCCLHAVWSGPICRWKYIGLDMYEYWATKSSEKSRSQKAIASMVGLLAGMGTE